VAPSVAAPTRLRRRLTVAFVVVAGVLTGLLAGATYLMVREARLSDSLDRAEREARLGLRLAAGLPADADLQQFVEGFEDRGTPALLVRGDRRVASSPSLDVAVPPGLRALVDRGQLAFDRVQLGGRPYLLLGGRPAGSAAELYLAFPEGTTMADLDELGRVLLLGWVVTIAIAGAVGWMVARRTLAPIARASRAARALAEGLLDTRLPATGADEFAAWAASFNRMAEALQAKIDALTQAQARERRFTADVAHELRTPLTALVSEASILAEHLGRMPPEAGRPAELLIADVARLRRLVEDLMTISRFDSGVEDVRVEPLDLAALVEATIRARGWADHVRVRSDPVRLSSDRRRVETVVANLVANAVEHGGVEVSVRVGTADGTALVEVSDRGSGIPAERLPHVFERFFKADPARAGGSGLGLSIARENARLLGGDVDAWSEPGRGSRFTLRLPVTEPLRGGDPGVASGADHGEEPTTEAITDEADPRPARDPRARGHRVR
jgi:signal transduction histidine kinase